MFQLNNTLVSEEIIKNHFQCNVSACKGACCVEGEIGAPLEKGEAEIIEKYYDKIEPYISNKGKKKIKEVGQYIFDSDGNMETPLVNGKECVYVHYNSDGILHCGIEKAYSDGKIPLKKPLSCDLYPVRIKNYSSFTAVNYHSWKICSEACSLGKELQKPLYKFVKDALIRRFGNSWYSELERVAKRLKQNN